MLQRTGQTGSLPYETNDVARRVDLVDIYTFLKANRSIIAGWTIVLLTAALVYAFSATPLYTATTDVSIDSRKVHVFKSNDQVVADQSLGDGEVASEVEILNSETIAADVVKDLKLTEDPEFVDTSGGLMTRIVHAIFGINEDPRELSDAQRERIATDTLRGNLTVRRVALSYVLEISYRATSPQKAARIANAVASAYITDQLDNRYEAARRASIWLQERIAELRDQSNSAARAVEAYKEKHNIVDTGGKVLLSDLQLQQFNSQLTTATAATAEAKARLDRVQSVLQAPVPGEAVIGTVSETLQDPVITQLRQRYLTDRENVAKFTAMMGPKHLAVINLKSEMAELQNSIVNELQRIAQVYKSDYEIAKAREDSLRASLSKQIQTAGVTGKAQVDLKELESASQTYHTIFENFLEKYTEAVQQQSFPISDARVITPAVPPYSKSYPKTKLIALLGLLLGLGVGTGHALMLRNLDRTLRRPRDVEERLRTRMPRIGATCRQWRKNEAKGRSSQIARGGRTGGVRSRLAGQGPAAGCKRQGRQATRVDPAGGSSHRCAASPRAQFGGGKSAAGKPAHAPGAGRPILAFQRRSALGQNDARYRRTDPQAPMYWPDLCRTGRGEEHDRRQSRQSAHRRRAIDAVDRCRFAQS